MAKGAKGSGSGSPSSRGQLAQRVRTAASRTISSTRWLQRQLNDPYVAEAQKLGYRSRAAFKLIQLDERFHVLKKGQRVLDLGCAPGGWSQIAVQRVGSDRGHGFVLGIDLLETPPIPGALLMQGDFMEETAPEQLKQALGGLAHVVLSDMAANTTGHTKTDHIRTMALCEAAFDFAEEVLAPGGAFIAKTFQGGSEKALLDRMKRGFAQVRHAKPPASRAESAETYVVALGWRGVSA